MKFDLLFKIRDVYINSNHKIQQQPQKHKFEDIIP